MPDSQLITFDSLSEQSSYIKVIGVGGGGNNAVNHMFRKGISGVDFIVCNTDMKALKGSPVPDKLVLGHEGLGVGGRPAKARKAAEEKESEIKALFEKDTKMVFITAGMGGGTGTGAAPVIARMAKEIKLEAEDSDDPTQILVVAVVTTPFLFEGFRRLQQAQEGVEELRKYVDSILVINNEKLRAYGDLVMTDAFAMANDVLLTAVKGIAEIITLNAYVNIDFRDVYTVMENSGTALMGIGEGEGEKRAKQAVEEATTSVLLNDNDIKGATNVLLHFSFGPEHEITMDEMGEVTDYITQKTGSRETNVIWGMGTDDTLGDKVKITLIATGFEQQESNDPVVHVLKETPEAPAPKPIGDGPVLIHRDSTDTPTPQNRDIRPENIYVAPTIETVATPTPDTRQSLRSPAQPDGHGQDATPGKKHIIPLYGEDELKNEVRRAATDEADDGLRLVNHTTPVVEERVAAPKPTQVVSPEPARATNTGSNPATQTTNTGVSSAPAQSRLDMMAMDRAERIKAINNLLRNDVNGAQKVEAMTMADMLGTDNPVQFQPIEGVPHSAQSEATGSSVAADGSVRPNTSLFGLPD